ncbi:hypothetical protein J2X31_001778 [Flavobacterium arsenatis]|uniref:Carboxypeptidase-like regulatory domain-containing protein n=1 Tax=Flavobacterium arsenatis TaxID=1484332 RepID=A0ABU1TPE9_9FLAO|nr:hypothetical protein [Flavobacterium arsenatis]MDR6967766.1 hypothetical protein [Flavobacterium arsenatis]
MNKITLLFFLLFSSIIWSQTVERELILKDADTNLPIVDATVYIVRTKQSLLSNSNGVVTFDLKGTTNITVTHTAYDKITLKSSILTEKQYTIYLKSNLNDLDEIVVSRKHPQKILKDLIKNSIAKLNVPARLKVYSREFFKLNGNYSYYTDGLMNFQIFSKANNFKSNILVEQNRSYGLVEQEITENLLGYNFNNIMENYYNFKYLEPLLESKALKEYDFAIKIYSANKDYYLLTASPTENAKGLLDDYTIIYDPNKKMIVEVSSFVSQATLSKIKEKNSRGAKNIYKSLFKTIYRIDGNHYYLLTSKEEIAFERIDKKKVTDVEVRNYFVTTQFSTKNFLFDESDVFKDKNLFNRKNTILTEYWNDSGLVPTDEEKSIIEAIGKL